MFFRQNSVKLSLFLIIGILLGYYADTDPRIPLLGTSISLALLALIFTKKGKLLWFGTLAAITTMGIGFLAITMAQPNNQNDHYSHVHGAGPNQYLLQVQEVLKSNAYAHNYIGSIIEVNQKKTNGKILLSLKIDSVGTKLKPDDRISYYGNYSAISPPLNPHQFNYKNYLNNLGIYHRIPLETPFFQIRNELVTTSYGWAFGIREKITNALKNAAMGEKELGIVQALLLGQRTEVSAETINDYVNAGAIHILAVSGLHIGILLIILQFVLAPLKQIRHGQIIQLTLILLILWGYAFLAGFSASIVRAVAMFSFLAFAMSLNRPTNTFNILALSLFFILLIEPMFLFQVGFQMSYTAVFAILWIYPMLQKLWSPSNTYIKRIWQLMSVSIAAQLGVLPIALFYFHQFPGLFFLSNLAIVPFLGVILSMGIVVIALAMINFLPPALSFFYNEMITLLNNVVGWIGNQESFVFRGIPFDLAQVLLGYALLGCVLFLFSQRSAKRLLSSMVLLIFFQSYLLYANYNSQTKEEIIVLHQSRNTALFHRTGNTLAISTTDQNSIQHIQEDYMTAERIKRVHLDTLHNSYLLKDQLLYVLDSLGTYPPKSNRETLVLMTQSPKINLERFIDSVKPKFIIADGSNYRGAVQRWKQTCLQKKIPFHYTGEKGAFYFTLDD
ncbi:ComEC/Rec2 family competence protein [Sediminicola sp. 1XM1-17]|uniref:ComEC/Rec2 family competence protein n=1 Tax=Sediminicola sp. 1XM1-17 TaxID=3127702 RepID=UPI0030787D34